MEHDHHDVPMPAPNHGGEGAHNGEMTMHCSMSMVWNTSTRGMCVVFPSWHVTGPYSFLSTLVALFVLAMLLEYLRFRIRILDAKMISVHKLSSGILHSLTTARDHRRKASVQQVLGHGSLRTSSTNGGILGGPNLVTTAAGLGGGSGDRRVSPSHTPSDTSSFGSRSEDDAPLLPGGSFSRSRKGAPVAQRLLRSFTPHLPISQQGQLYRSTLYVVTLALSMFVMLVFMTYNAWLIGALLFGAGLGHYLFNRDLTLGMVSDDKTSCH